MHTANRYDFSHSEISQITLISPLQTSLFCANSQKCCRSFNLFKVFIGNDGNILIVFFSVFVNVYIMGVHPMSMDSILYLPNGRIVFLLYLPSVFKAINLY